MSKRSLLLTLGHNSSAILVEDNKVLCGYENERLSKVKSDSAFPSLAIMECLNQTYTKELDKIYISYWNDSFDIFKDGDMTVDKHYDRKFLNTLCKHYGCTIQYLSEDFTHHDAHAYAALNFFENHATEDQQNDDWHVIVSDGFGNKEEVTTIYHKEGNELKQIDKVYDYFSSVGLMYQYATSFCGMKENEDEYKFLGYESHLKEVLDSGKIERLYEYSNKFVAKYYLKASGATQEDSYDSYINVNKLMAVKEWWKNEFETFLDYMDFKKEDHDIEQVRVLIAAFIQNNIEKFIGLYLEKWQIKNVILSGGIFYNVKLNNYIMNHISGKICVYPLCGDIGCSLGIYRKYHGKFEFKTLLIGKRNLKTNNQDFKNAISETQRFEVIDDRSQFVNRVTELLKNDKIVNMIVGPMEIGPRALCSTTTLALPTDHNFKYINKLNGRNAVMPFAPVILEKKAEKYFGKEQIDRIIGSNYYMIITMDHLIHERVEKYTGILHKYPLKDVYSSRCQFISDDNQRYIKDVLENLQDVNDFFIQTSHNEHGHPILFTAFDGLQNHLGTIANDDEERSYTLIGSFND